MTAGVEDRAFGYRAPEHVFQTHRLCGELEVVVQLLPFRPVFEFDRVHTAIQVKFDQVGLADKAETVTPQRQCALHPHAGLDLVSGCVDQMVHRLPARRVDIVGKGLLQMNQPALARAIGPVLEGGKGNRGVRVIRHGSTPADVAATLPASSRDALPRYPESLPVCQSVTGRGWVW